MISFLLRINAGGRGSEQSHQGPEVPGAGGIPQRRASGIRFMIYSF